jgi:hypothetical protein
MKFLSTQTFQCGITVQGSTTLAGTTYLTGITNTASWDYVVVGTSAQGQLFTRTYAQLMSDISSGITLSLDGLSDVVAPTPLTGQLLRYNGVQWANWTPTYYSLPAGGTTLQYIDGTGALQTFPSNLPTSSVKHQVKAGVAINKGQAVYVTSADGTNMIVGLASNASEATSSKTMGLLDATVSTNGFANVVTEGLLAGLDTSTAGAAGDPVWLGTGGNLIYGLINKPYAPAHLVFIGIVTRKNSNNGEIFVKVQNGFELDELHDVDLKTTTPVNGHLLGFNGTLWVNKTIAGWLGYTPANASGTTNYISKFTGSTTLGNSLIYDDGSNVGIGTTTPVARLSIVGTNNASGLGVLELITSGTNLKFGGNTDYSWIQSHNSNPLRINELGNNVILNLGGGNVGIGTSSPAYKLDVAGYIQSSQGYRFSSSTFGQFTISGGQTYFDYDGDFRFRALPSYNTSLIITNGGNIGIGTVSPGYKLDISTTSGTSVFRTLDTTTGYKSFSIDYSSSFITQVNFGLLGRFEYEGNGGVLSIENRSTQAGSSMMRFVMGTTERMRITDTGNVGIGTTTPGKTLDITGEIRTSGRATFNEYVNTGFIYGNTDLVLAYSGGTSGILINSSGNVGIGTNSPGYKLEVNGTGYFTGNLKLQTGILSFDGVSGYWGNAIKYETGQLNLYQSGDLHLGVGGNTITLYKNTKIPHNQRFTAGGYSDTDGITIWGTQNASAGGDGFIGRNLYYNGTNYIYASTNDNNLWGTIAGMRVVGSGSNALEFIARPATNSGLNVVASDLDSYKRMVISYSGNVGIGTSSPSSILDAVVSSGATSGLRFKGYSDAGTPYLLSLGTQSYQDHFQIKSVNGLVTMGIVGATGANPDLAFQTNTTERMRITSSGQLIVGGTTVGYAGTKLQVGNTSDSQNGLNILTSTTGYGYILFGDGAGADTYVGQIWYYHADNYMGFQTNGSEKMRITSTGDVGIGTNSPQTGFKLDVNGSTVTRGEIYSNSSIIEFSANGNYKIAQSGNTWLAKTSGNVGIGTSSPNEKLHVAGNIHAYAAGGIDSGLFASTSAGSTTIAIRSNGVTHFNGGNVGIGTNNPKAKFQINNGHIAVYHNVSTDGAQIYLGDTNFDNSGYWNSAPGIGSVFSPGTTVAGDLAFYVYTGVSNSRTERMRITDAGNVGIGTTSPTSKLHVVGETKVTGLAAAYTFFDQANATYYSVWYRNNNITYLYDSYLNSNPFVINSSGNVGIGTTSPGARLTVQTSTASSADSFRITDGTGVINIGHWDTITNRFEFSGKPTYFVQYGTGNYISFGTLGSENMRIVAGGNVGIGTSSPSYKLDVVGSVRLTNSAAQLILDNATYSELNYGTSNYFRANGSQAVINGPSIAFLTGGTEKVRIDATGNVGIGTTSPSQFLHVAGNIRVTGAFYDSNNQAGTSGQILKSTGSGTDWVSLSEITGVDGSGTANYVTKWSDADTITNSLIYDNGTNVGIGTTSPGYNFDVNGQVRVQDKLRVGTVNSGNGVVHMSSSATINPSATTIVWAQNVSVGMCAFIEYYILNNNSLTDQRAGTIMVTWNQSGTPTIAHTETTTPDIGSTIAVNFTSSLVGSDARINAVNSSANPYTIVMSYKYF